MWQYIGEGGDGRLFSVAVYEWGAVYWGGAQESIEERGGVSFGRGSWQSTCSERFFCRECELFCKYSFKSSNFLSVLILSSSHDLPSFPLPLPTPSPISLSIPDSLFVSRSLSDNRGRKGTPKGRYYLGQHGCATPQKQASDKRRCFGLAHERTWVLWQLTGVELNICVYF